jgi:DNA polymerase
MGSESTSDDPRWVLCRSLRQKLELERLFGREVPLRRRAPQGPKVTAEMRGSHPPAVSEAASTAPRSSPLAGGGEEEKLRREQLLEPFRRQVAACQLCGLCRARKQAVFGVGSPLARLMFIGEAPGFDEDRLGEPFVGRAGKLLDDIIRAMRLRREDVYIANIVKCRPPENRVPDPEEVGSCLPYLERQIEIVNPEVICLLGATAARALLHASGSLGSQRGRFFDYRGRKVRVTYHPAYLLRNPQDKRKTWEDVQEVMRVLGV